MSSRRSKAPTFPAGTEKMLKIVFETSDMREALMRNADPTLLHVLAWLVRPETHPGYPPFMHDFPDAPASLDSDEVRGFMDNYMMSTVFNKDVDTLKNDIVKKMKLSRQFRRLCYVLFHQNYIHGSMKDTEYCFLRTFIRVFREAFHAYELNEKFSSMLINFNQPQHVAFADIEEKTGLKCLLVAEPEQLTICFEMTHESQSDLCIAVAARMAGMAKAGITSLSWVPVHNYYLRWTTPELVTRLQTSMDDPVFRRRFNRILIPFYAAQLGQGPDERVVQFSIEDGAMSKLFKHRRKLEKLQYGGVIPVPPLLPHP